jgi:DNA repair protein RecO (recombination protein O)
MASVKSPGLILKKIPFSDTSLILKVFTRESGLITLIAKGAKRPKSKYHGLLDFFTLDQFIYPEKSKSEIHTLLDAGLVREFPRIKSDPGRQSLGHVFMELYLKYMSEPAQSHPHYELLLERLEQLDEAGPGFDPVLHLCDFLLGLCSVSGFSPQFTACVQCGREDLGFRVRMDPDLGGPVCGACIGSGAGAGGIAFPGRLLRWLDRLQDMGVRAGRLPREEESLAEDFLLSFLGKHAGGARPMKSLDFYHQMLGAA